MEIHRTLYPECFAYSLFSIRRSSSCLTSKNKNPESGQVLVIGAFIILALTMISITVANVGMVVSEKIHLQDTTDAAAYSAAVTQARYMNLTAYLNRAMVANYNSIAFNEGLWATIAAHDHGSALMAAMLYELSVIVEAVSFGLATAISMDIDDVADAIRDYMHSPMHELNQELHDLFSQDETDLNQYIERYNTEILSIYGGLLYAAMQSARYEVIKKVAGKMDPKIKTTTVMGLGAETISFDQLAKSVDYAVRNPSSRSNWLTSSLSDSFDRMAEQNPDGDDELYFLGAVSEASLDQFAAGRTREGESDLLRQPNAEDIIGGLVAPVERWLRRLCKLKPWHGSCRKQIKLDLGAVVREGQEDYADQVRVPFIANKRLREANGWMFNLDIHGIPGESLIDWAAGSNGYTSADRRTDVGNSANVTISVEKGAPGVGRFRESIKAGSVTSNPFDVPSKGLNSINMRMAQMMGVMLPFFCDDHWDGIFDAKPVNFAEIWPPGGGQLSAIRYFGEAVAAGGTDDGVPNYDWKLDLENVGFYNYILGNGGEQRPGSNNAGIPHNTFTGPSVAAVGVKRAGDVHGLKGLGISNEHDLRTISRAQVYYLRNPNRPEEVPNLFNPHWAARLAPLDGPDSPPALKEGLPYVGSAGLNLEPTR